MKLDFVIAGVQKGGTTALDQYLRMHPSIQMAAVKEVHFFDDETVNWNDPVYTRLHAQYNWDMPGVTRGEATPIYTYWPNALDRLSLYNSAVKIVVLLRHPSLRAHSHWRMESKRGLDPLPFSDAIREPARHRVSRSVNGAHRVFSYVERGFYGLQIERLYRLFPRENVLVLRTDRLWSEPAETLNRVQDFLGVPRALNAAAGYVVPEMTWRPQGMSAADRGYLDRTFAADIRRTGLLADVQLDDWLDPQYAEPMQPD